MASDSEDRSLVALTTLVTPRPVAPPGSHILVHRALAGHKTSGSKRPILPFNGDWLDPRCQSGAGQYPLLPRRKAESGACQSFDILKLNVDLINIKYLTKLAGRDTIKKTC
ncbi:hypothetical protein [Peribacillus deserti]|uniref:Uncharacterized protein n=1 Tax=Peribacillus deserti TaxID=673318 RepID=A0A2N5M7M3_9BACI|nr:hypothetical protein [Peribacillus deserti]PLT30335.1 hypothetical protein CUU66_08320 [Peribacillus deserti]